MCKRIRDLCIKLVIINKLHYDAQPAKYQEMRIGSLRERTQNNTLQ